MKKVFGLLDAFLVFWISFSALSNGCFPVYSAAIQRLNSANEFGIDGLIYLSVVPSVIVASLFVSAPMLLFKKDTGVLVSLAQEPFRLLFVVQPTLFFVFFIDLSSYFYFIQVMIVFLFESYRVFWSIKFLLKKSW